ncbi:Acyltransferase-like protein, chloroplastic, partial [Ananas comosus]
CRDNLLPSKVEAGRLQNLLANCKVHYFEDHGHNLLLEHGVHVPTLLKCSNMYRHSRKYDRISDFLPPTLTELRKLDKATRVPEGEKRVIILRGIGHPLLFTNKTESSSEGHDFFDFVNICGGREKEFVLLYPGGHFGALHG